MYQSKVSCIVSPSAIALAVLLQSGLALAGAEQAASNVRAWGFVDTSVSSTATGSSLPLALTNPTGVTAIASGGGHILAERATALCGRGETIDSANSVTAPPSTQALSLCRSAIWTT